MGLGTVNWSRVMYFCSPDDDAVKEIVAMVDDFLVWRGKQCKPKNVAVQWIVPKRFQEVIPAVLEHPAAIAVADDEVGVVGHVDMA